jgi:hypothetical protein
MAHFYVINPARKLRLLTTLFYRGSRRILGIVDAKSLPSNTSKNANSTSMFKVALGEILIRECEPIQDEVYYKHSDAGYCVFQVENTLFKVISFFYINSECGPHLSLQSSIECFLPENIPYSTICSVLLNPMMRTVPASIRLRLYSCPTPCSNSATSCGHCMRRQYIALSTSIIVDFILYRPSELYNETHLGRLLNVAELTNKYCFSSLEAWVLERIYVLLQEPNGLLPSAPPDVCARMLEVAILCNHRKLLDLVTQHLIRQILWYSTPPEAIIEFIEIAKAHGLPALQGAGYYRQLINMEFRADDSDIIQPRVPLTIDSEQRMRFFSAHHSLLNLWDRLRTCPPTLSSVGCPSHAECSVHWENMWFEAGALNETLRCGSADVLGRLKAVMITIRKSMCDAPGFTLPCKMAALETIAALRDEIVDGLMDHFTGY